MECKKCETKILICHLKRKKKASENDFIYNEHRKNSKFTTKKKMTILIYLAVLLNFQLKKIGQIWT